MEHFIKFLRYEDRKYSIDILKRYARYIDDNVENKCIYCKYDTCSENDDCFEGILERLVDKI